MEYRTNKLSMREYLEEKKLISRWIILVAGLAGAGAGAILMFLFALLGIIG